MSNNPSFLRKEATKKKGPHGMQTAEGVSIVAKVIAQVVEAFKSVIRPAAPEQTRKASASPLARGPLGDVKRGPAPPPGAIRHDRDEDDNGDKGR
ncbi:MAG: hypothetical protein ACHQAX_02180 [Gammaproteobacteria bacterium]